MKVRNLLYPSLLEQPLRSHTHNKFTYPDCSAPDLAARAAPKLDRLYELCDCRMRRKVVYLGKLDAIREKYGTATGSGSNKSPNSCYLSYCAVNQ